MPCRREEQRIVPSDASHSWSGYANNPRVYRAALNSALTLSDVMGWGARAASLVMEMKLAQATFSASLHVSIERICGLHNAENVIRSMTSNQTVSPLCSAKSSPTSGSEELCHATAKFGWYGKLRFHASCAMVTWGLGNFFKGGIMLDQAEPAPRS